MSFIDKAKRLNLTYRKDPDVTERSFELAIMQYKTNLKKSQ